MTLSLDTNVLIDLANSRTTAVRDAYEQAISRRDFPCVCAFAAHELVYGARISHRPDHQEALARRILGQMSIADWTFEDADTTAHLRANLRKLGQPIGSIDSLIAGQALARGWTLVTANVREFSRIEGLNVIDWTAPSD